MKKNILITGAAGFIGFHLAQALHKRGDHVLGYDNFNDYYPVKLKRRRSAVLNSVGIKVIEGDICDRELLGQNILNHRATHIVHLAAQPGVRYSLTNPHAYIKANIEGFLNILEACRANPAIILTYASSSSVYGLNTKIPFSVEDRTDRQASLYGATKQANELMAHTYHHLFGIPVTGLRFFTVYGPWGRPDMAYYSFAESILADKPLQIYNDGNMKRDFTYIDDIIDGTIAAVDLGAGCEIFNLGGHRPEQLMHLVELLEKELGKKARIQKMPMQPGDVESTYADIQHSRKMLGFKPKITLDEGIRRFVKWYLNYAK